MLCYKVIFVKNEIISCAKTNQVLAADEQSHFEHHKGRAIHAIVQASSEENAKSIALDIMKEIKKHRNNNHF
jgi:hypothetical protein